MHLIYLICICDIYVMHVIYLRCICDTYAMHVIHMRCGFIHLHLFCNWHILLLLEDKSPGIEGALGGGGPVAPHGGRPIGVAPPPLASGEDSGTLEVCNLA